MRYWQPPGFNRRRFFALLPQACTLLLAVASSCGFFSTDVPLHNNVPSVVGSTGKILKTMYFPDSTVCTLTVRDLNDTNLTVFTCITPDSLDTSCSSVRSEALKARWLTRTLGTNQVVLTFRTDQLGTHYGHVHVADPDSTGCTIPFVLPVKLFDPLRNALAPTWVKDANSSHIFISGVVSDNLQFMFQNAGDSAGAETGIRSRYAIKGDLETGIFFQLRDDMLSGFRISFFLSTSAGTGPWDGDKTGFSIAGIAENSLVRITTQSVNLATESRELARNAGQTIGGDLTLTRNGDTVGFFYTPLGTSGGNLTMNRFYFPGDTPVYVHVRMAVDDQLKTRHCFWSDFFVNKGRLTWPE